MGTRSRLLGLAIVGAVSLAAGIAVAAERLTGAEPTDIPPVRYASTTRLHTDEYAGSNSDTILSTIVSRSRTTSLIAARLGAPPEWAQEAGVPSDATWAYFTVAVDGLGPEALRGIWEADLIGAALRDALMAANDEKLLNTTITLSSRADGKQHEISGALGNVEYGQRFHVSSEEGIRERTETGAERNDLDLIRFEVVRADQPAPRVRLETDDPNAFVQNAPRILQDIFGASDAFEGTYAEVVDSSDDLVYVTANTLRSGVGRTWIRPDLDPRRPN